MSEGQKNEYEHFVVGKEGELIEKTDVSHVFDFTKQVLEGIKGEPLNTREILILKKAVDDADEMLANKNLSDLERKAEDLFYLHYFGLIHPNEIPGVKEQQIGAVGWEKLLGEYWRKKIRDEEEGVPVEEVKETIPELDKHNDHDHYFMDYTPDYEKEMIKNKKWLDFNKLEKRKKELFLEHQNDEVYSWLNKIEDYLKPLADGLRKEMGADVHDIDGDRHTVLGCMEILKDEGFEGTLSDLKKLTNKEEIFLNGILTIMAKYKL